MRIILAVLPALAAATHVRRPRQSYQWSNTSSTNSNITIPVISSQTIWQPPANASQELAYARAIELQDGTLLATIAVSKFPPGFPIYQSKDEGRSWTLISNVTDPANPFGGPSMQPALVELKEDLFNYTAGTVFAAGTSFGFDSATGNISTIINLYASTDKAQTWEFVSEIAQGGTPGTNCGDTAIWEPFLLIYNGQMVAYYSDSRDPDHCQKLSHQTSNDLIHWEDPVDDAAYSTYSYRPGMAVVTYIPPIKKWIMVYEFYQGFNYPVNYRIADDPLTFGNATSSVVKAGSRTTNAGPYVSWSSIGGDNGTIIVTDSTNAGIFVNQAGGNPNAWTFHSTSFPVAYTPCHLVFNENPDRLFIVSGGIYQAKNNPPFRFAIEDLNATISAKAPTGFGGFGGLPRNLYRHR